jgi:hypothetical protein
MVAKEDEPASSAIASFAVGVLDTVPSASVASASVVVELRVVCAGNNPATDRASGVCSSIYAVSDPFAQAVSVERVEAEQVSGPGIGR